MIIYKVSWAEFSFFFFFSAGLLAAPRPLDRKDNKKTRQQADIHKQDILSGDELFSDTFNIKEVDGVLWEADCRKYLKGAETFQLEGANPSATGEDADEGGDGEGERKMVYDIEDQFRLVWLKAEEGMKPSKEAFKAHLKSASSSLPPFIFPPFAGR